MYSKEWYEKNKEKVAAQQKEYYQNNKEKRKLYRKQSCTYERMLGVKKRFEYIKRIREK